MENDQAAALLRAGPSPPQVSSLNQASRAQELRPAPVVFLTPSFLGDASGRYITWDHFAPFPCLSLAPATLAS